MRVCLVAVACVLCTCGGNTGTNDSGTPPLPTVSLVPDQVQLEHAPASVLISLSETSPLPITVDYVVSGTATNSIDYVLPSGSVTIPPGQLQEVLDFSTINDAIYESNETVVVTLTAATNALLGTSKVHTYTILNDEPAPYVSFVGEAYSVIEGNSGPTPFEVTVTITPATDVPVSVQFNVGTNSTALSPDDYTIGSTSSLTIPAGDTSGKILLTVAGDTIVEGAEYVTLTLQSANGAMVGPWYYAKVTIRDNDCLGSAGWAICPDTLVAGDVGLGGVIDTDAPLSSPCNQGLFPGWTESGQPPACIVIARNIYIGTLFAAGKRPLVLVALDSITVSNWLSLAGYRGYKRAGWFYSQCAEPAAPGPGGGGAGGSFMTSGGAGGSHTTPAGAGGVPGPALTSAPAFLRAGCPGQTGNSNTKVEGAGDGGGGIYLVAGNAIVLEPNAVVDASGAEGWGSVTDPSNGGNAGGSGGMIVLNAPMITAVGAFITANGGGGAEGATNLLAGTSGGICNPRLPFVPAVGGSGTQGGDGGQGFAQGSAAASGASGNSNNGGGGGGGGAGYIHANQPLTGASVSPAPS